MGKTLILSDVHLRYAQINEILEYEEEFDRAIFLGDYFDQWHDTPESNGEMARWLKDKLQDPKFIFLIGNHDWQYMWPQNMWTRTGFTVDKMIEIRKHMNFSDFQKLLPYYVEQGILLTHAGIDNKLPQLIGGAGFDVPTDFTITGLTNWIDAIWPSVLIRYQAESIHPLMEAGVDRGGIQRVGGITWRDFNSHNPIPLIGQIVGHTTHDSHNGPLMRMINSDKIPMWKYTLNPVKPQWLVSGWTLGMDTANHHYIILENETITIKKIIKTRSMEDMTKYNTRIIDFKTIDLSQYYKVCKT